MQWWKAKRVHRVRAYYKRAPLPGVPTLSPHQVNLLLPSSRVEMTRVGHMKRLLWIEPKKWNYVFVQCTFVVCGNSLSVPWPRSDSARTHVICCFRGSVSNGHYPSFAAVGRRSCEQSDRTVPASRVVNKSLNSFYSQDLSRQHHITTRLVVVGCFVNRGRLLSSGQRLGCAVWQRWRLLHV